MSPRRAAAGWGRGRGAGGVGGWVGLGLTALVKNKKMGGGGVVRRAVHSFKDMFIRFIEHHVSVDGVDVS